MQGVAEQYDVVVLGGGAGGLMGALTADPRGRRVLVLEKANKVGKKILMSGGGRCNFTNLRFVEPGNYVSANAHFGWSALSRFTPSDFIKLVEKHGIAYHEKEAGRLFCDDRAQRIVELLMAECRAGGVTIKTGCAVRRIVKQDGFQVQSSYTYSKGYQKDFFAFRKPYVEREQNYTNGSASLGNVRHNMSVNWVYELPFGRGRKWGSGAGSAMNRLIGDWSIMGLVRWQSGRMVDFGNVRLNGFTADDLRSWMSVRKTTDQNNQYRTLVWWLPQDIIDNTVKAFNVSATGYTKGTSEGRWQNKKT